jgi:hypothetical protein
VPKVVRVVGLIAIPAARTKKQAGRNVVPAVALAAKNEQSILSADPHQQRAGKEAVMVKNQRQVKKDEN